jgi:hypothetical protein
LERARKEQRLEINLQEILMLKLFEKWKGETVVKINAKGVKEVYNFVSLGTDI